MGSIADRMPRMIASSGGEPPSALDLSLAHQWALTPTALFAVPPLVTREGDCWHGSTDGDAPACRAAAHDRGAARRVRRLDERSGGSLLARLFATCRGAHVGDCVSGVQVVFSWCKADP